ncbi:MAG: DUF6495 family protein [Saprospiraceae bacterium]
MESLRILTLEELELLKPEFIRFLSSHSISAADWEKWKTKEPQKTEEYIKLFSEFIFFSIIEKTKFMVKSENGFVSYVKILPDKFYLVRFQMDYEASSQPDIVVGNKNISNLNKEVAKLFDQGFLPVKLKDEAEVEKIFHQIEM